jgi:hypothetical protein
MDRGYYAIPAIRSGNPRVPACFYDAGDYTCVKDASASWWDSDATARNGSRGCWRMPGGGRRYLTGIGPPTRARLRGQHPRRLISRGNQSHHSGPRRDKGAARRNARPL